MPTSDAPQSAEQKVQRYTLRSARFAANNTLVPDRNGELVEHTSYLQLQHERDCAVEDVARLVERERQAAIILATALAGGGSPEQAHWMHDAAVWLNDRRATDVTTNPTEK